MSRNSSGLTSQLSFGSFAPPAGTFSLRPDTRSAGTLFVPSADLPVTTSATFTVDGQCSTGEPFKVVSRFGVAPAAVLPTAAGAASVLPVDPKDAGVVLLGFRPSAEVLPFLGVTMLELSTNGAPLPWGTVPYGEISLDRSGSATLRIPQYRGHAPGLCGPSDNAKKTLPFELRVHVAGASADPPPLSFTAEIDCADPPRPAPTPVPTSPPPTDAGVDDPGATNPSNLGPGGCSAGSAGPLTLSPFGAFGLGALVVGLRRLQRRRRRAG